MVVLFKSRIVAHDSELLERPRVLIVGAFGSGKSHLMHSLLSRCERDLGGQAFFLKMKDLSADQGVWERLTASSNKPSALFVDGLDEAPSGVREETVARIGEISESRPHLRVVLASRPTPELDQLRRFEQYHIAPLSDVEVVATLARSIDSDAKSGPSHSDLRLFMCHLSERPNLLEPLRNPLFLRAAWSLFAQSAVTPFSDVEVVGECVRRLLDRDQVKGVNRLRAPWASQHRLMALLGELSFHMLKECRAEIDESDLDGWMGTRASRVPVEDLLELLLLQGMLSKSPGGYRFAHKTLQEYLAASHIVESVESAADYFAGWSNSEGLRTVLRLACGIANDATSLLRRIIDSDETNPDRYALLAEILAQPVSADASVVDKGCSVLVSWLDQRFEDWSVDTGRSKEQQRPIYSLYATGPASTELRLPAENSLKAIHRARSGPAYKPLRSHLKKTRSELLPVFADLLDVEGRLDLSFVATEHADGICASVGEPRLV